MSSRACVCSVASVVCPACVGRVRSHTAYTRCRDILTHCARTDTDRRPTTPHTLAPPRFCSAQIDARTQMPRPLVCGLGHRLRRGPAPGKWRMWHARSEHHQWNHQSSGLLTHHSLTYSLLYTHYRGVCADSRCFGCSQSYFPLQSAETETRPVSETPCFMQSAGTEVTVFGQGYGLLGGSNESASHEFTSPKCVHFPPMRLSGCNGLYFPRLYATVARLSCATICTLRQLHDCATNRFVHTDSNPRRRRQPFYLGMVRSKFIHTASPGQLNPIPPHAAAISHR